MEQKGNSINFLDRIKSSHILKYILENIEELKLLEIAKYNKALQKKIGLSLYDYKNYSEIKSKIELEIIAKWKGEKYPSYFIYFYKEKNNYFHIFFNDDKVEMKRRYINENDKVDKIKVIIDKEIKSFGHLFNFCRAIESINFTKFYRKNINDMSGMFMGCSSLKELNLNSFNTINVTNMCAMFADCSSLKQLNLSTFRTSKVFSMMRMFSGCSSLKELDLSNFETHKVNDLDRMFELCTSLKKLNLSNFTTENVTSMPKMFYKCSSLEELIYPNMFTYNCIFNEYMFGGCKSKLIDEVKKRYPDIYISDDLDEKYEEKLKEKQNEAVCACIIF